MGEVYRAPDTKLEREVAIKVLPEAFAQRSRAPGPLPARSEGPRVAESSEHRASFTVSKTDGGIRALVMELVEGADLGRPDRAGSHPTR